MRSNQQISELVAGNTAFAFSLYPHLARAAEGGNAFFSPHSISAALAMTSAGARGGTAQQMAEVLHFGLPQEELHPAFNVLDLALASRGEGAKGKDDEGFRLNIANAIWGQAGYEFLEPFLDVLAQNYAAGMREVDYANNPDGACVEINDWVSKATEGRIPEIVSQEVIDQLTRLVLTNAIYFNAAWAAPFPEWATKDGPFYLLGGGEAAVPMMHNTESFGYAAGKGYQAVELPYDGGELSMVIILPDAGAFGHVEGMLGAELTVEEIVESIRHRQVALSMPRWKYDTEAMLSAVLVAMGMADAFNPKTADFSGMAKPDPAGRNLFISEVIHKAFVSVDEEGTEAAAATAVIMSLEACFKPEEPIEVTVDRPFIYLIRDIETGAVLFVGRVMDPSK